MDWQEATRLVFSRVQALDPENVSKIIGWLLMQNRAEQEMLRLALASDIVLQTFVVKARKELGIVVATPSAAPASPLQQQQQQQQQLQQAQQQQDHQPVLGGAALQQHVASVQLRAQGLSLSNQTLSIVNPSLTICKQQVQGQCDSSAEEEKQQLQQAQHSVQVDLRDRLWSESGGEAGGRHSENTVATTAAVTTRLARFPPLASKSVSVHSPMLTSRNNLSSHPLKLVLPSSQAQNAVSMQQQQQQPQHLTLLQHRQLTAAAAAMAQHHHQQQQQHQQQVSGVGFPARGIAQQQQQQQLGGDLFFDTQELLAAALNRQSPSGLAGSGGRITGGSTPLPLQQSPISQQQQPPQNSVMENGSNIISSNGGENSPIASQAFAWKPCLYFAKGYCKHGSSCRFLHGSARNGPPGGGVQLSSMNGGVAGQNQVVTVAAAAASPGGGGDAGDISSAGTTTSTALSSISSSLQRLEGELYELLKGRRTPVSIASLPQLYYERFGKSLQAEGYLTESQRHGKAGYSLTKLLARLKDTVTLIDRPHGQHAVVLSEDAHKHLGTIHTEREESSRVNNSSARQIYLTFPADSTFSEDDVSAYFRGYGPVQDVRIPFQQKRMFGFVTFQYASTVKLILSERNPHFICNARVLVKPYREKKQLERMKCGVVGNGDLQGRNGQSRLQNEENLYQISGAKMGRYSKESEMLMQKIALEEQITEYQLEAERLRMAELQIADMQRLRMVADNLVNMPSVQSRTPGGSAFDFLDPGVFADDTPLFHSRNPLGRVVDALNERNNTCHDASPHSGGLGHSVNPFLLPSMLSTQLQDSTSSASGKTNSPFTTSITSIQQQQHPLYESGSESRSSGYCGLGSQSLFSSASTTPISGVSEHDLTCPICLEYFTEPVELDCSHTFCEVCISQVMRANKECPICRRHVGPHIAKYLEMKDTHACLQSVLRGVQSCW